MSNLESSNRVTMRHARDSTVGKMALNLDLNFPPAECLLFEETSGSRHPQQISRGACQPCLSTRQQQGASAPSSSFIDLDLIEDEVVTLSSSEGLPTGRTHSRRKQPVAVILEEDREINCRRSVLIFEDQVASSSFTICKKRRTTINCDLYPDVEEEHGAKQLMKPNVVEPVQAMEQPTFTCPICMDKLVEPASTICGHIFCISCTKASIQAQKKCPTCRRKLTMKSFHRIYLPV